MLTAGQSTRPIAEFLAPLVTPRVTLLVSPERLFQIGNQILDVLQTDR